jgi:hypothetical protein
MNSVQLLSGRQIASDEQQGKKYFSRRKATLLASRECSQSAASLIASIAL